MDLPVQGIRDLAQRSRLLTAKAGEKGWGWGLCGVQGWSAAGKPQRLSASNLPPSLPTMVQVMQLYSGSPWLKTHPWSSASLIPATSLCTPSSISLKYHGEAGLGLRGPQKRKHAENSLKRSGPKAVTEAQGTLGVKLKGTVTGCAYGVKCVLITVVWGD